MTHFGLSLRRKRKLQQLQLMIIIVNVMLMMYLIWYMIGINFVTSFHLKDYVPEPPSKKAKKQNPKEWEKWKIKDSADFISTLQSISKNLGTIFQDINVQLSIMANAWSHAKEWEQKLDDKKNTVLEEVMKLEDVSPSESLKVATILMAEEHKFLVFYQAPHDLRKQYVLKLLKKI